MEKHVEEFLFGLCFGMGFCIARALLDLIGSLITRSHPKE